MPATTQIRNKFNNISFDDPPSNEQNQI